MNIKVRKEYLAYKSKRSPLFVYEVNLLTWSYIGVLLKRRLTFSSFNVGDTTYFYFLFIYELFSSRNTYFEHTYNLFVSRSSCSLIFVEDNLMGKLELILSILIYYYFFYSGLMPTRSMNNHVEHWKSSGENLSLMFFYQYEFSS